MEDPGYHSDKTEGEGGYEQDQTPPGLPPRAPDEPDGLDHRIKLLNPAAWVPTVAAGVHLSFAHGSGAGYRGASLGTGALPFLSPALAAFADMSSHVNPTALLDYSSSTGMNIWSIEIEGIANKFDFEEVSLYLFLEEARRRAEIAGGIDPLSDCISIQMRHVTYSSLTEYGRLYTDNITRHAKI
eukprot:2806780-Ditylum_brightwellii.AAC.1